MSTQPLRSVSLGLIGRSPRFWGLPSFFSPVPFHRYCITCEAGGLMTQHIYLRAYMAGIVVPTIFFLIVATVFTIARYVYNIPVPVERVIVFPMAVVPNAWGLWNVLFVALRSRLRLSIGLHGALLPILLAPLGIVVASLLNFPIPLFAAHVFPIAAPVALIVYYFAWKYLIGFLNRVQGIA